MDDSLEARGFYDRERPPRYVAAFLITALMFLGAGFAWVIAAFAYLAWPVLAPLLGAFLLVWLIVYAIGWNPWEEKEVRDE
jgi:hypothetical protein